MVLDKYFKDGEEMLKAKRFYQKTWGVQRVSLSVLGILVILLPSWAYAATVIDTIQFPGGEPLAVAVYESGNKIFVTEDNSGSLFIIDGTTHQTITTAEVGGAAFDMVVNETYGKVYVASTVTI